MDKLQEYRNMEVELGEMAKVLKCGIFEVAETVEKKLKRIKVLESEVKWLNSVITKERV